MNWSAFMRVRRCTCVHSAQRPLTKFLTTAGGQNSTFNCICSEQLCHLRCSRFKKKNVVRLDFYTEYWNALLHQRNGMAPFSGNKYYRWSDDKQYGTAINFSRLFRESAPWSYHHSIWDLRGEGATLFCCCNITVLLKLTTCKRLLGRCFAQFLG